MKENFNKNEFAHLLSIAKGERTQSVFANEIGISKEHLSRLLNRKTDSLPFPDTLRNIANASRNRISYIQLLTAAGYLQENDLMTSGSLNDKKPTIASIMTALSALPNEWISIKKGIGSFDLAIKTNCPDSKWYFICSGNETPDAFQYQLQFNYFQILQTSAASQDKFTFATSSLEEYAVFIKCKPKHLAINLSVILVDPPNLKIIEETYLLDYSENFNVILPTFNL